MSEVEYYRELLSRSLEGRLESPEIKVIEDFPLRYIAVIVSPTFEGMDENDRQVLAWQAVYDHISEDDRRWIFYMHTYTPAEVAEFARADEETVQKG